MSSKNKQTFTAPWDSNRGIIRSSQGGWFAGKGVFNHGYDMMRDLVGKTSYMQVVILNATGRLPSREFADWFDAVHICLSWPDSRIWCNHIGALAGTSRASAVAATTAGLLACDSKAYGPKTIIRGIEFIQRARSLQLDGYSADEIVEMECNKHGGKPMIVGYARPLAKGDERIEAMERTAENLGFEIGKHLELAYDIEKSLIKKYNEGMNINGYFAAFFADQGYSPEEAYRMSVCVAFSGITACYGNAMDKPATTFLPMRCDDINYKGKDYREVPDQ